MPAPDQSLNADARDVRRWQRLRFGLFLHWDPISLKGVEISWSRAGRRPEPKFPGTGFIPIKVYDNLYKKFDPVGFNAGEWARLARKAGARYVVFTAKHHDGFAMFDSALTDYKITNSPFQRDVAKELAEACRKAGLKFGFYYSPPDWRHPDYRTGNHRKYIQYMHDQLRELCSRYGRIDIIWFDGLGGSAEDWDAERLFRMIRRLQPRVIINDRAGLAGDYGTPEQTIGKFQMGRPWESCMTLGAQWSWKANDEIKSLDNLIETLVRVAGANGNLLLNVGPGPDGHIDPAQARRLAEMGDWLKAYGNSIYDTRGGPFMPGRWGASTRRGRTIYLHILDRSRDSIVLPALGRRIVSYATLTGRPTVIRQTEGGLALSLAPTRDERDQGIDTIVALRLNGSAEDLAPLVVP